jgi:nucleoside-diphosphate-sugar epimerase
LNDSVLITGGTGFLGTHIAKRLIEKGLKVKLFSRNETDDLFLKRNCDSYYGDIRDLDKVLKAAKGVNKIVHLVSNFRRGGSDKKEAYGINVNGTDNILNAAYKLNVDRLVHCSTIGVHGNVKEIPANENTPFNPGDLYQETKLIAEKNVWNFYKKHNLPITVIRPISMYGPGDLRMLKLFKMIKRGTFVVVGNGKPYFQPAYIEDVVDGFVLALKHDKALGEAFIIGNEEYLELKNLFRVIANELEVREPFIKLPLGPTLVLARLCEAVLVPLGIEPPLHRRRISFFQNNRAFSIQKAKNVLDFAPQTSLEQGIRITIQWYEQQRLL